MRYRYGSGAILILLFSVPHVSADDCELLNVYRPDEYRQGRSISIRPFEVVGVADGDTLELRQFSAQQLENELRKRHYFSSVTVLGDGEVAAGDFNVEGVIGNISGGNRVLRAMFATGQATAELHGSVRLRSGEVLADFGCLRSDAGGLVGAGGLFALMQSGASRVRKNVEKFAGALAKSFPEMEKLWAERQSERDAPDAIAGESERAVRGWRGKDVASWTPKDHLAEVRSFVVETNRKDWNQTQVLWLSQPAYRSHTYLVGADTDNEEPVEASDLAKGLLLDLTPLRPLEARDVYVLAVTFNNATDQGEKAPFFWDAQILRDRTYLVDVERPERKIDPVEMIDLPSYLVERRFRLNPKLRWRSHSVVFAFPVTRPDGSPWLERLDQVVALHSQINGRDVQVTFKLADFELSDVSALRLTGR